MNLPGRIRLSKRVSDRFRKLQGLTGVTPNLLSRIAISLAIEHGSDIRNAGVSDTDGQEINRDVLFGDLAPIFDTLIAQYAHENDIEIDTKDLILALIEIGAHKMGHVKKVEDLLALGGSQHGG